jgi:uncharacterized protein YbjT (DUF2867 family)
MRVVVIGATGTAGRPTADVLAQRGHDVRRMGRRGSGGHVDLKTGEGLDLALADVDAVVNASNGPASRRAADVLVGGTRRLLERTAAHHVCLSIVGIEALCSHSAYYEVKVQQEQQVTQSGVPFTIVRSTQFHEFLGRPLIGLARARIRLRSRARLQPVAVEEVAAAIADAVEAGPRDGVLTVAGPEILTVSQLAAGPGIALPLPLPLGLGRALREGLATEPTPDVRGTITWRDWLSRPSAGKSP